EPAIRYLILDVGPAVSVEHQELDRVAYTMRESGDFGEPEIADAVAYTRRVFDAAYRSADIPALVREAPAIRQKKWADQVQIVDSPEDLEGWRLIRYDPKPILKRTAIPMLALFGEIDAYVPPKENVDLMRQYLDEAGNKNASLVIIPRVKHDMESY